MPERGCHFCDGPCPRQQSQTLGRARPEGSGALPGPAAQTACFEEWVSVTTRSTPAFLPFRATSSRASQGLAPQSRPTGICLGANSSWPAWDFWFWRRRSRALADLSVSVGSHPQLPVQVSQPSPGWAAGPPSSPTGLTSGDTGCGISFRPGAEIEQAARGRQVCRASLRADSEGHGTFRSSAPPLVGGGREDAPGPAPGRRCLLLPTGQGQRHLRPRGTDLGDPDSVG